MPPDSSYGARHRTPLGAFYRTPLGAFETGFAVADLPWSGTVTQNTIVSLANPPFWDFGVTFIHDGTTGTCAQQTLDGDNGWPYTNGHYVEFDLVPDFATSIGDFDDWWQWTYTGAVSGASYRPADFVSSNVCYTTFSNILRNTFWSLEGAFNPDFRPRYSAGMIGGIPSQVFTLQHRGNDAGPFGFQVGETLVITA